jgi:hypothetical protein
MPFSACLGWSDFFLSFAILLKHEVLITKHIVCIYLYIHTVNKHNNISDRSDI